VFLGETWGKMLGTWENGGKMLGKCWETCWEHGIFTTKNVGKMGLID